MPRWVFTCYWFQILMHIHYLTNFFKKLRWKSDLTVSLMKRFFISGSSLAWLRKITSSFHLLFIWTLNCKYIAFSLPPVEQYLSRAFNIDQRVTSQRFLPSFSILLCFLLVFSFLLCCGSLSLDAFKLCLQLRFVIIIVVVIFLFTMRMQYFRQKECNSLRYLPRWIKSVTVIILVSKLYVIVVKLLCFVEFHFVFQKQRDIHFAFLFRHPCCVLVIFQ